MQKRERKSIQMSNQTSKKEMYTAQQLVWATQLAYCNFNLEPSPLTPAKIVKSPLACTALSHR